MRWWSKGLRSVASGYAERSSPLLFEFGGEGRRCGISKRRVRARRVEVSDPDRDFFAGVADAHEQRLVQKFIAHPSIETLDERILRRLAWRRVMPLDLRVVTPGQHGIAREFSAVVADNHSWLAAFRNERGQFTHHPLARYRCVRDGAKALTRHVIDDIEHSEPATRDELIVHKVETPALVGERQHGRRHPRAHRAFAPFSAAYRQAFFTIEALCLLVIDQHAMGLSEISCAGWRLNITPAWL